MKFTEIGKIYVLFVEFTKNCSKLTKIWCEFTKTTRIQCFLSKISAKIQDSFTEFGKNYQFFVEFTQKCSKLNQICTQIHETLSYSMLLIENLCENS